jgi:Flp pilus assembly protein TadG
MTARFAMVKHTLINRLTSGQTETGRNREEGSALVEMAVTLPLIMLIMTGVFSFSVALYQKLQLAEAVSNAGRYLAVDRGDHDPCATAVNAIYAAAPGLKSSSITITVTLNGVKNTSGTCPGTGTATPNSNLAEGSNAMIQASFPTGVAVFGAKYATFNLASQITEVVQ